MSRDDRIELRDLPPVAPLANWPDRLSMTLARWLDRCPRAGYLYVKTGGGAPTPPMDRGSLAHEALAMMMVDWMGASSPAAAAEAGPDFTAEEVARYTAEAGAGYAGRSDEEISSLTAVLVAEALDRHPEWEVPHAEKEVARLCVYHAALALDVSPEDVVAVERKFVLELECGWTISGKVDLASFPANDRGQVDDYKTQLYVPPKSEWDPFQQKMYAVFLVWGRPVERVPCATCGGTGKLGPLVGAGEIGPLLDPPQPKEGPMVACSDCRGRGSIEEFGDPIGGHLAHVTGREIYPRKDPRRRSDTKLWANEHSWTRMELLEFLGDLNAIGERLHERMETWKFPARYSESWCGECPDEDACPIPRGYRRFAGHLAQAEPEQVGEAWAWAQRMKVKVSETESDVKKWAAEHEAAIVAGDTEWSWTPTETKKLKTVGGRSDWTGLEQAIVQAIEHGEEFKLADWLKTSAGSSFKKKKRPADAVVVEDATVTPTTPAGEPDLDRRFGADAPY